MTSTATAVTIRDAAPNDAEAIRRVAELSWRDTYGGFLEAGYIESYLEENYSIDALRRSAARAAERETSEFMVAERDGTVVAYLQFGVGERGPELFRFYADPAHQRTGVGSALLAELHRRIAGRVDAYVLDVHSRNERGRSFYERNGFVIIGGGETQDCDLTMRRRLVAPDPGLPITTSRLRLRSLDEDDAERLHEIYGDAEAMRHVGPSGRPSPDLDRTRAVLAWLRRHEELHGFSLWAIDELDGDPLVGVAGLLYEEGRGPEVEVAYLLRKDRWGRGYATEATRAVLAAGHGALGLERIVALAYPENDVSRRVMEKAGMRPAGETRAYGRTMTRHASEPTAGAA